MLSASPLARPSPHQAPNRSSVQPNVSNVVLGNVHVKPWYPSFYPEETIGGRKADWLYVCQHCFRYSNELIKYCSHCKVCPAKSKAPPGDLIYEKDGCAIHQIDGEEHKLYAQNLSLFAKLFLDTKSVFFDVSTFLYYTLILRPDVSNQGIQAGGQCVGFFSKEKMSWDNNNVACILIFPPWQRRGLGQMLMAASYHLGKQEGRFGGPERPLSTLGRKGYVAYWSGEVARFILASGLKKTVNVKAISEATWILPDDIVAALKEMDAFGGRKTPSGSIVVSKARVKAWAEKHGVTEKPAIDVSAFLTDNGYATEDDGLSRESLEDEAHIE